MSTFGSGVYEFEDYLIAHQLCIHGGSMLARVHILFTNAAYTFISAGRHHGQLRTTNMTCCPDCQTIMQFLLELENDNIFNYQTAPFDLV
jgi:hypothetical protein